MRSPLTATQISVNVNGATIERTVPVRLLLSDFIRDHLGLTGTHVGCEHGVCGACNVLLDGQLIRACLTLAVQADQCSITTVEGLAAPESGDRLHPAQRVLLANRGLQCGFCTPGVVMTLAELAVRPSRPTPEEAREELSGNLCRCTGYHGILAAAHDLLRHPQNPDKEERP